MSGIFSIIKNRWSEVVLVVVLQAGIMVLWHQIFGAEPGSVASAERLNGMSSGKLFGLTFGITAVIVIWQMLYFGFLASSYADKDAPQQPRRLLIIGRYFFWRIVRFQILLLTAQFLIAQVLWGIGNSFFKDVLGDNVTTVASMAAFLILIKPLVLCPAIMIVKNCMVLDSLRWLKSYCLRDSGQLLKLIVVCFGTMFMLSMVLGDIKLDEAGKTVIDAIFYLLSGMLTLVVYLGGMRYVASMQPPAEKMETPGQA